MAKARGFLYAAAVHIDWRTSKPIRMEDERGAVSKEHLAEMDATIQFYDQSDLASALGGSLHRL